jgi:two-component system sensor histidine kinase CiaH
MFWRRLLNQIRSTTIRLASSYLAIIMLMSIAFSVAFYATSSHQLGRQIPPPSSFGYYNPNNQDTNSGQDQQLQTRDPGHIDEFLQKRIMQGRSALKIRLIYLNVAALLVGSVVSLYLARRTLWPIEDAIDAQVQFVNDASHELRTPLTAIKAGNDVALRSHSLTLVQAKQIIEQNSEDIDRLQQLAEGLLSLAEQDQSKLMLSESNLQDIVSRAMTQVVQQANGKNITVSDEVANLKILTNAGALEQVLVILLDNAIKYSNNDSQINLRTRKHGKTVMLDVTDHGIGIKPDDMHHLFQRFYRADTSRSDAKRNGYGLGLAIAKRIMLQLGSDIRVTSEIGKGSTFTLKLVLAAD